MKIVISILFFLARIYIGFKILHWVFLRLLTTQPHPISEIEVFLVYVIFDIWMHVSNTRMEEEMNDLRS